MADLHITGELADRIRKAAEDARLDVEALLDATFPPQDEPPVPGTAKALLASALQANIRSGQTDIAERSREILEESFAEHVLRYQDKQDNDDKSAAR